MRRLFLIISLFIAIVGIGVGTFFFLETQSEPRIEGVRVLAIMAQGFDYGEYAGVVNILTKEGAAVTAASFATGIV